MNSPRYLDHNLLTHRGRRTVQELTGLYYTTIERSKVDKKLNGRYKLVKPRKKYTAQLKLRKEYPTELEIRKGYSFNIKG